MDRIRLLANNPRPSGCQKLSQSELYRIRQGDYRIVYEMKLTRAKARGFRAESRRLTFNPGLKAGVFKACGIKDKELIIHVIKVGNRREIYRST
ncbi:MAG: hypothetical protein L6416_09170 [Candidatus Omnitrophica bacterium]|nr:hypothetical protein [Candidatus Omnitrophota bacterium]